jgi:hypothetical protein
MQIASDVPDPQGELTCGHLREISAMLSWPTISVPSADNITPRGSKQRVAP